MPPSTPESAASTVTSAVLLATAGGLLDAVVYLNHGHVFANAMTGNVVFLGISAVSRDWGQIFPHLAPIAAYIAGVSVSRLTRELPLQHHGTRIALSLEILTLFGAGFLPPSFPQAVFTATVAMVSAMSSKVCSPLHLERDPAVRYFGFLKFRSLGLICLGFLAGATAGAFVAPRFPVHAVWFAEPMLLAVLLLTQLRPAAFIHRAVRTPAG